MSNFSFKLLSNQTLKAARAGRLTYRNQTLETPIYVAPTSRGVVPHLTPDNVSKHTSLGGVYVGLEDFLERPQKTQATPPLLALAQSSSSPDSGVSPLQTFTALPLELLLILGARRTPPVACPSSNTNTSIAISTSVGFQQLPCAEYDAAATSLRPDVVVALGDVSPGEWHGLRRRDKMCTRTERWIKEAVQRRCEAPTPGDGEPCGFPALFAPVLPVSVAEQQWYLDLLTDDLSADVSGLALYTSDVVTNLPAALDPLPRLSLEQPGNPQEVLRGVSLGIDVFTPTFASEATDAGVALSFHFPPPPPRPSKEEPDRHPLGMSLWDERHTFDASPLVPGCSCAACRKHSRAYVRHLLETKEMLAWVLLQMHNLHVLDGFFAGVRGSISVGGFEADREGFEGRYEGKVPAGGAGRGPRVRGYQAKSEAAQERRNEVAFRGLDKLAGKEGVSAATAAADGEA